MDLDSSAASSSFHLPNRQSLLASGALDDNQSSSNISRSSESNSRPEVYHSHRSPFVNESTPSSSGDVRSRFLNESTSSSSEDHIGPADDHNQLPLSKEGRVNYSHRYDPGDYVIEQLSVYDDCDLVKPWHRKLILIHPFVIAWVFSMYAAYYGYRIWCNYQFRKVYGGLADASWIFICLEGVILRKWL